MCGDKSFRLTSRGSLPNVAVLLPESGPKQKQAAIYLSHHEGKRNEKALLDPLMRPRILKPLPAGANRRLAFPFLSCIY